MLGWLRSKFQRAEADLPVDVLQDRLISNNDARLTYRTFDTAELRSKGLIEPLDKSRTIIADGIAKVLAAKHGIKLP